MPREHPRNHLPSPYLQRTIGQLTPKMRHPYPRSTNQRINGDDGRTGLPRDVEAQLLPAITDLNGLANGLWQPNVVELGVALPLMASRHMWCSSDAHEPTPPLGGRGAGTGIIGNSVARQVTRGSWKRKNTEWWLGSAARLFLCDRAPLGAIYLQHKIQILEPVVKHLGRIFCLYHLLVGASFLYARCLI
jgi:hypothetical protein